MKPLTALERVNWQQVEHDYRAFGPPGVGKTTSLARLPPGCGTAAMALSWCSATGRRRSCRRLAGRLSSTSPCRSAPPDPAALESFAVVGRSGASDEARASAELARLLVPRNVFWSLRLRQYMLRLSRTWRAAAQANEIVLFDQGFVQAVWTLRYWPGPPMQSALALAWMPFPKRIDRPARRAAGDPGGSPCATAPASGQDRAAARSLDDPRIIVISISCTTCSGRGSAGRLRRLRG